MSDDPADRKRRWVTWLHRSCVNPVAARLAPYAFDLVLLETTGRRTGIPRQVPVTGTADGSSLWLVSEHGWASNYVRNISAEPRVRVRTRDGWRTGTAHLVPDDDPYARLRAQPWLNALLVRAMGTAPFSVRIDLDESGSP